MEFCLSSVTEQCRNVYKCKADWTFGLNVAFKDWNQNQT